MVIRKINKIAAVILIILISSFISCKSGGDGQDDGQQTASKKIRAVIKMVFGKAVMFKDGSSQNLKKGLEITDADYIQTYKNSRAEVIFNTGTSLSLQENTKINIKVLLPKGIKANLSQGNILLNVKKLTNDENFSVSTPTALAGVRGTKFFVEYNPGTKSTRVAVKSGRVRVSPRITAQVEENTQNQLSNAISVDVTSEQSVNVNQAQVNTINSMISNDIQNIRQASSDSLANVQSVQKSASLLKKQMEAHTQRDKTILNQIPDREQQPEQQPEQTGQTQQPQGSGERYVKVKKDLPRIASTFNVGTKSLTTLLTSGGRVYFVGADKNFYIVNMKNGGSIVKKVSLGANVQSRPVLYGGVVYIGTMNSKLFAINATSGAVLFTKALKGPLVFDNTITPYGNYIYFTSMFGLYKLNRLTGNPGWSKRSANNFNTGVAVDGKKVYAVDEAGILYAYDINSGKELWKTDSKKRFVTGKVFVYGNKVVAVTGKGRLIAVKAENGEMIQTNTVIGRPNASPYQLGALAYYPTTSGLKLVNLSNLSRISVIKAGSTPRFAIGGRNLYAADGGNSLKETTLYGKKQWNVSLGSGLSHNPAADKFYVYALTNNGKLYKINRREFIMVTKKVTE